MMLRHFKGMEETVPEFPRQRGTSPFRGFLRILPFLANVSLELLNLFYLLLFINPSYDLLQQS